MKNSMFFDLFCSVFDRLRDMKDALRWWQELKLKRYPEAEGMKQENGTNMESKWDKFIASYWVWCSTDVLFFHHFFRILVLCFKLFFSFDATWLDVFDI